MSHAIQIRQQFFTLSSSALKMPTWDLNSAHIFEILPSSRYEDQCTEVRFASLLSGGFTTTAVINPPERNWQNASLCSVLLCPSSFDSLLLIEINVH